MPIRHLQRWVSRRAVEEGWTRAPSASASPSRRRVAVLGAGAAGVSATCVLASLGHSVTLYDAQPCQGGTARNTIPEERLPDDIIRSEIRAVLDSCGDLVQTEVLQIGDGHTLDDIMAEGFDAVLIAMGLSVSIGLPGTTRPERGVIGALEFLETTKGGGKAAGSVLVLGGGNTAIDAALSAMRAGAADVSIVYRRSFAEMPAWPEERDMALRSGINFLILTAPLCYMADDEHRLTGLRVVRTRPGAPGIDGRRQPIPIAGSEHVLPADLVVEALGQRVAGHLQEALGGLRFTERGLLWTREGSLETSRRGVFAAGDIINGGTTVVQAVAEGARAAREIDAYLRDPVPA